MSQLFFSAPPVSALPVRGRPELSTFYHLQPGDVIYTGTPEGIGPVKPRDKITGAIAGVGTIALTIGPPGWCRPKRVYVAPTFRSA